MQNVDAVNKLVTAIETLTSGGKYQRGNGTRPRGGGRRARGRGRGNGYVSYAIRPNPKREGYSEDTWSEYTGTPSRSGASSRASSVARSDYSAASGESRQSTSSSKSSKKRFNRKNKASIGQQQQTQSNEPAKPSISRYARAFEKASQSVHTTGAECLGHKGAHLTCAPIALTVPSSGPLPNVQPIGQHVAAGYRADWRIAGYAHGKVFQTDRSEVLQPHSFVTDPEHARKVLFGELPFAEDTCDGEPPCSFTTRSTRNRQFGRAGFVSHGPAAIPPLFWSDLLIANHSFRHQRDAAATHASYGFPLCLSDLVAQSCSYKRMVNGKCFVGHIYAQQVSKEVYDHLDLKANPSVENWCNVLADTHVRNSDAFAYRMPKPRM